ncbi:MAG: HNH endonuclease [Acidimicrobiales bacterium]
MTEDEDRLIRLAAFTWLGDLVRRHGEIVPWSAIVQGIPYRGDRVQAIGQQGIVFPRAMSAPLSIMTTPERPGLRRPYDDELGPDGELRYHYQRGGPNLRVNDGLRRAMQLRLPLVWFCGIARGEYLPVWPVQIVDDDPHAGVVTVDMPGAARERAGTFDVSAAPERLYAVGEVRRRLHQARFRQQVMSAYRSACAICSLRHGSLLDAAHILPDGHPNGLPIVPNGMSLCKIHHAAFDQTLLGVRPDLVVEVRRSVLEEEDGPMLRHGLQECHGQSLTVLPRRLDDRPRTEYLDERFERFRAAG